MWHIVAFGLLNDRILEGFKDWQPSLHLRFCKFKVKQSPKIQVYWTNGDRFCYALYDAEHGGGMGKYEQI